VVDRVVEPLSAIEDAESAGADLVEVLLGGLEHGADYALNRGAD
jgi:hypothetical protein